MIELKLADYLDEHEISLHWLHKQTGIRYATLHELKNKNKKSISLEYLYQIMKVLNIKDMNLLLERKEV